MTYLSVLHLATAGLNGPLLGSDEEEIVLICLVVLNTQTNQVCTQRFSLLKTSRSTFSFVFKISSVYILLSIRLYISTYSLTLKLISIVDTYADTTSSFPPSCVQFDTELR
jgi:hypothetical protein